MKHSAFSIRRSALLLSLCVLCVLCVKNSYAQSTDCPADKVCISREAAIKAVTDADKVTALETEGKAKDTAIADLRDLLNKMRIEFAEKSGENTALKQNAVQDRAIIEVLLKSVKKKCILSFCF